MTSIILKLLNVCKPGKANLDVWAVPRLGGRLGTKGFPQVQQLQACRVITRDKNSFVFSSWYVLLPFRETNRTRCDLNSFGTNQFRFWREEGSNPMKVFRTANTFACKELCVVVRSWHYAASCRLFLSGLSLLPAPSKEKAKRKPRLCVLRKPSCFSKGKSFERTVTEASFAALA